MKEFDKTGENDSEIIIRFLAPAPQLDKLNIKKNNGGIYGGNKLSQQEIEEIYTKEFKKIISKLPPNCKLISVTPADGMGDIQRNFRRLVLFFEIENSSPKKRKNIKYHFINIRLDYDDGQKPKDIGEEEWRLSVYNRKLAKELEKLGVNARVKHAQWIEEWPGKVWQLIIENEE